MNNPTVTTVGRFTIDSAGVITGPADYMRSADFRARKAAIESGRDVTFSYGAAHIGEPGFAASIEVALLVSFQTDFAAFQGLRTLGRDGRALSWGSAPTVTS